MLSRTYLARSRILSLFQEEQHVSMETIETVVRNIAEMLDLDHDIVRLLIADLVECNEGVCRLSREGERLLAAVTFSGHHTR